MDGPVDLVAELVGALVGQRARQGAQYQPQQHVHLVVVQPESPAGSIGEVGVADTGQDGDRLEVLAGGSERGSDGVPEQLIFDRGVANDGQVAAYWRLR